MISSTIKTSLRTIAIMAAMAAATVVTKANSNFTVFVDTSALVGNLAGPFSLDFQLNDGSGLGDSNNTASLSNFQFGSGSAVGSATTSGGASGDLTSGITITDSDWTLNEFYQSFVAGTWLSFNLSLSTNIDLDGTPDLFSFAILDGNLMNLATQSFGSDNFLEINVDSLTPSVATFASADGTVNLHVPDAFNTGVFSSVVLAALVALKRRRSSGENVALSTDLAVCRVA